jgi:hypothetical protein
MTFRDPWIDPRVTQVRVAAFQRYLEKRGWRQLPESPRGFLSFQVPGDPRSLIRIPGAPENDGDYLRLVIQVITDMAQVEGKYAVELLNDILACDPSLPPAPGNGAPHEPAVASSTR